MIEARVQSDAPNGLHRLHLELQIIHGPGRVAVAEQHRVDPGRGAAQPPMNQFGRLRRNGTNGTPRSPFTRLFLVLLEAKDKVCSKRIEQPRRLPVRRGVAVLELLDAVHVKLQRRVVGARA